MRNVKRLVLNNLLYARRDWDRLLARVGEKDMFRPGVCGQWSVKELIAHITWYDRETEQMIRQRRLGDSPLWQLPTDERNEAIARESRFGDLDHIKGHSLKVFAHLLDAVETADKGAFIDPGYYQDMPGDWQPLEIIAGNTWGHYARHAKHLEQFIEEYCR